MLLILMLLETLIIFQGSAANVQDKEIYVPFINEGESEPSCAVGRNYCDHIDKYPKQTILKLLQRFNDVPQRLTNYIFDDDLQELGHESDGYGENSEHSLHVNVSMVNSKLRANKTLCNSKRMKVRPLAAKNEWNEWLFIVNVDGYSQYTYHEVCQDEDEVCTRFDYHTLEGHCKQEKVRQILLALDPSGNTLKSSPITVNSCCKCLLYKK